MADREGTGVRPCRRIMAQILAGGIDPSTCWCSSVFRILRMGSFSVAMETSRPAVGGGILAQREPER